MTSTAGPGVALMLVALCLHGCAGASFYVHVRPKGGSQLPGASVLLYAQRDDACTESAHAGQLTDAQGRARVQARWCGQARLVVAANGYQLAERAIDSCSAQRVAVTLEAAPSEPTSDDDGPTATARRFVTALQRGEERTVEALLADRNEMSHYRGDGSLRKRGPPALVRPLHVEREEPSFVDLEVTYLRGCVEVWRVFIVAAEAGYRVERVERRRDTVE